MKNHKLKTLFIAFTMAILMCVFTTLLSISFADENDEESSNIVAAATGLNISTTNIDLIIENSHNGTVDQSGKDLSQFYIVEVGSKNYSFTDSDYSPLFKMLIGDINTNAYSVAENGTKSISDFARFVIDMHSTKYEGLNTTSNIEDLISNSSLSATDIMNADKINFEYIYAGSLTSDTSIAAAKNSIMNADFIYLSDNPTQYFNEDYDIPQDVMISLDSAVNSKKIPFIIDSLTATEEIINMSSGSLTFNGLVSNVYGPGGSKKYTSYFNMATSGSDVTSYLNRLDVNSLYLPIRSDKSNWLASVEDDPNTEDNEAEIDTSRILIIKNSNVSVDADNTLEQKFTTNAGLTDAQVITEITDPDNPPAMISTRYTVPDDSAMALYGYAGENIPKYIQVDVIDLKIDPDYLNTFADTDYANYDLFLFENSLSGTVISESVYSKLAALMYDFKHIIYDKSLDTGSNNGNGGNISIPVNYKTILDKVSDSNGVPFSGNVLVSNYNNMVVYSNATTPKGVKDIVDIINNGSYRGNGNNGDGSTNTYRVLEIQPAYPIDSTLAPYFKNIMSDATAYQKGREAGKPQITQGTYEANSFYYLKTDGISSKTTDEISYDGTTSVESMFYYDGGVKKLNAYGQSLITSNNFGNIKDYYAWELSTAKIAHATGLKLSQIEVDHMSTYELNTKRSTLIDSYDLIYIGGNDSAIRDYDVLSQIGSPAYTMYYKKGAGFMTGNDITESKLEELTTYVNSGLPVVISEALTTAWANNGSDNKIDPESNMQKLASICEAKNSTSGGNVLFNFDPTCTVKVPNDGTYGTTYNGMVTVFDGLSTEVYQLSSTTPVNGTSAFNFQLNSSYTPNSTKVNEKQLSDLIRSKSHRPKYVVTGPVKYEEGKESTVITDRTLSWTYKITDGSTGCVPKVFVDDNTDGKFTEDEQLDCNVDGNTLTFDMAEDFFGGVYWKFVLENSDGTLKSSTIDLSRVKKPDDEPKSQINLLQILPAGQGGQNGKDTLFLCTECQQYCNVLYGNRKASVGKYTLHHAINADFGDGNNGTRPTTSSNAPTVATTLMNKDSDYLYTGNNLGVHIHNFGIVKYDSEYELGTAKGIDIWESNWAYELLDDYEFNTSIVTTREFEAMIDDINSKYSSVTADNFDYYQKVYLYMAELYKSYYDIYKSYYIEGNYFSDNSGHYYSISDDNSTVSLVDENSDDGVSLKKLNKKLINGISSYEQYCDDIESNIITTASDSYIPLKVYPQLLVYPDDYSVESLRGTVIPPNLSVGDEFYEESQHNLAVKYEFQYIDMSHPVDPALVGKVIPTDLPATNTAYYAASQFNKSIQDIFNACETNKTGLGLNNATLNKYVVAQKNLDSFFTELKNYMNAHPTVTGEKTSHNQVIQECDYELTYKRYSDFASLQENDFNNAGAGIQYPYKKYSISGGSMTSTNNAFSGNLFNEYYNLFYDWRDARIIEDYLNQSYIKYLKYSSATDSDGNPDLTKVYGQIVIGSAEDFGDDDIRTDAAFTALESFIDNDGFVMLFHETLTANQNSTANMNSHFRELFAQNIDAEVSNNNNQSQKTEEEILQEKSNTVLSANGGNINLSIRSYHVPWSENVSKEIKTFTVDSNIKYARVVIKTWSNAGQASISFEDVEYADSATGHDIYLNVQVYADHSSEANATNFITKPNLTNSNEGNGYNVGNFDIYQGSTAVYQLGTSRVIQTSSSNSAAYTGLTQFEYSRGDINTTRYMNKYVNVLSSDTDVDTYKSNFDYDAFVKNYKVFTDTATQVNKGIVTMYPFMIGDRLRISSTHPGAFAANINDDDVTVWYTLDGGSQGSQSVLGTADPHDGADNYFVYSYGNVVYMGAGHNNITGIEKNNNDERRLIINIIVNTAHKSIKGTNIKVFDYKDPSVANNPSTVHTNKNIKPQGSDYIMTVNSTDATPEFTYLPTMDKSIQTSEVMIYYDLSPGSTADGKFNYVSGVDELIYNMKYSSSGEGSTISRNLYKSINENVANVGNGRLKLDERYFVFEGNTEAHIVIALKTSNNKYVFKRIRVKLNPKLYDLT